MLARTPAPRLPIARTALIALALGAASTLGACPDDAAGAAADTTTAPDTQTVADAADAASTPDTPDTGAVEDTYTPPAPREVGARTPRTAACDDADPGLCLLPWPSSRFTVADPTTETGLRLAVDGASLPPDDPPTALNAADGYSRLSPLLTSFPRAIDAASLVQADGSPAIALVVAEGPAVGTLEPLRCAPSEEVPAPKRTVVVCYPRRPLTPATEHVAVVLDDVTFADGAPVPVERTAAVALGLAAPTAGTDEDALFSYHAPARAALATAGIAPERVLRLWDFTTRSKDDPLSPLREIRAAQVAAVDAGDYAIELDEVKLSGTPTIDLIVQGRLTGLPSFFDPVTGDFARDAAGQLQVTGTWEAPFRAVVPSGDGPYPVVAYCHGTGGNVGDGSFDTLMSERGALKFGMEVDGWTDVTIVETVEDLVVPFSGTPKVAARVVHSIAGAAAGLRALEGQLGDLLAADTVDGIANPAAGRRPDTAHPVFAGGSLGGVTGLVYGYAEPAFIGGVLNVPGAGFTHWLPASDFNPLIEIGLGNRLDGLVEVKLAMAMTQTLWDPMDGGVWADNDVPPRVWLVQTSLGDPVVANIGNDLVATAVGAVHVGAVLYPVVGVEPADKAVNRSALTQFHVPPGSAYQIHGFTTQDTVAGEAARQQFIDFVGTLWAGAPLIEVPVNCVANTPSGSCDFRDAMKAQ